MNTEENKKLTIRQSSQIDFSVADKNCEQCNGAGLNGKRQIENPGGDGQLVDVDVVCQCILKNGGLKNDNHRMFLHHNETDEKRAACLVAGIMSVGEHEMQRVLKNLKKKNKKQKTALSTLVESLLRKELFKCREQNSMQMN